MTTIIDELTVLLKLDSSQFDEKQRQAIRQLDGLNQQVKRVASTTNDDWSKVGGAISALSNPIQALKRSLEDLSRGGGTTRKAVSETYKDVNDANRHLEAMARRSGEGIRAGGMTAAEGFTSLARAGLVAFSALNAVNDAIKATVNNARELNALKIQSYGANMTPSRFFGIETVFKEQSGGKVSPDEVGNFLSNFAQGQADFNLGGTKFLDQFRGYARFLGKGVDDVKAMTPEQLMEAFAAKIQSMPGAQATVEGAAIGLTPGMVQVLARLGPQGFSKALTDANTRAPTDKEAEDASQLAIELQIVNDGFHKLAYDVLDPLVRAMTALLQVVEKVEGAVDAFVNLFSNPFLPLDGTGKPIANTDNPTIPNGLWGGIRNLWNKYTPNWMHGGGSAPPAAAPAAAPDDFFTAVSQAEGTYKDGAINWDDTKDHKPTPKPLTQMTIGEALAWDTSGAGLGGLQIDAGTLRDAIKALNIPETQLFDADTQKKIGSWIARKQGTSAWRGFNKDPQLRGAADKALNSGAYDVPGAVMNYGATGAVGAPGTNLVQLTDPEGNKYTVNRAAGADFQGFLQDLEGRGYKVTSLGGYNMRNKTGGGGLSEHAYGLAIDINPQANPYGQSGNDFPADIHALAAKHHLIWGGDWKNKPDPMHFQWGGPGKLSQLQHHLAGTHLAKSTINNGGDIHVHTKDDPTRIASAVRDAVNRSFNSDTGQIG